MDGAHKPSWWSLQSAHSQVPWLLLSTSPREKNHHRSSPTSYLLSICSQAAEPTGKGAKPFSLVSSGLSDCWRVSPCFFGYYPVTKTTTLHLPQTLNSTPIYLFSTIPWENKSHHERTSSLNYYIDLSTFIFTHTYSLDPCLLLTPWVCFCLTHFVFSPDSNISHLKNEMK